MTPLEIVLLVVLGTQTPVLGWVAFKVIGIDAKLRNGLSQDIKEIKQRQARHSDLVHAIERKCASQHGIVAEIPET